MKKTEWHYSYDKKKWWMITVATNSNEMPKLVLPKNATKSIPVQIRGINLLGENKKLWTAIFALVGCLGMALGAIVWMLAT